MKTKKKALSLVIECVDTVNTETGEVLKEASRTVPALAANQALVGQVVKAVGVDQDGNLVGIVLSDSRWTEPAADKSRLYIHRKLDRKRFSTKKWITTLEPADPLIAVRVLQALL